MAALARSYNRFLQQAVRSPVQMRQMSGGAHSAKPWKNAFFFLAVPAIILGNVNAFVFGDELEPPPFVAYDYLRIRTKKFPWGDGNHSLIHNPHTNALPDGYEEQH